MADAEAGAGAESAVGFVVALSPISVAVTEGSRALLGNAVRSKKASIEQHYSVFPDSEAKRRKTQELEVRFARALADIDASEMQAATEARTHPAPSALTFSSSSSGGASSSAAASSASSTYTASGGRAPPSAASSVGDSGQDFEIDDEDDDDRLLSSAASVAALAAATAAAPASLSGATFAAEHALVVHRYAIPSV